MNGNLARRLIVAAVGIPALVLVAYKGGFFLYAFCLLVALLGTWELAAMLLSKQIEINKRLATILTVGLVSMFQFLSFVETGFFILFIMFFITSFLMLLKTGIENYTSRLSLVLFTAIYPGFFISFAIPLHRDYSPVGWIILIFIFVNTWIADTFAYAFGSWLGRRKMAPAISPGKTWVGFIAAFPGGMISAYLAFPYLKDEWSLLILFIASLVATMFGQIGDLVESAIKRDCRVKDSSNLIPGHGGVLDRFDSLLFALPAVYFTLKLLG